MKKLIAYFRDFRRRPDISLFVGLGISALFLVLFSKVVWETFYEQDLAAFDMTVIALIRYPSGHWIDSVMLFITQLGSASVLLVLALGVLLLFLLRGWRREAKTLVICLFGAALLNQLLKVLFARARPELFRLVEETGYSFPSGHSMVSFCVYGFLAYIFSRSVSSLRLRILAFAMAAVLVAAIGVSRIYLGVHYPTDVLAGFVAGGTWLGFCMAWLHWREYRHNRRRKGY